MSFPATRRSECPRCDEGIKVGEPIEQNVVIPFQLITPDNVKDFK